jgi:uncharacterized protein YvpB
MKIFKQHKVLKFTAIVILLIALYLIYDYPIQRCLAKWNFEKYIELQGASYDDIEEIFIHKDYKQGGYWIDVTYTSDPGFYYDYQFRVSTLTKIFSYKSILLIVYDEHRASVSDEENTVKYPPLNVD